MQDRYIINNYLNTHKLLSLNEKTCYCYLDRAFTLSCHFCRLTVYNVPFHLFVSKWQSAVHASAFVLHLCDTRQVSFHK